MGQKDGYPSSRALLSGNRGDYYYAIGIIIDWHNSYTGTGQEGSNKMSAVELYAKVAIMKPFPKYKIEKFNSTNFFTVSGVIEILFSILRSSLRDPMAFIISV